MLIHKLSLACSVALGALSLCMTPVSLAADAVKSTKQHASAKAPVAATTPDPEIDAPDTTGSVVTEFSCELGNKITIFNNLEDDQHIALRWNKHVHRLTRVSTTTGAARFENRHYGLVWIGIPAKGMLLDSKQNRQLANECRNAEQSKPVEMPVAQS